MNRRKTSVSVRKMTRIAFFTAILSVLSQIYFPSPSGMPFTLQTFGICLCGYFLGAKNGLAAVIVYVLAGVCGIPVFSGFSGGIGHIAGLSGGFIIGFCPMALACGVGKKKNTAVALCFGACGVAVCHIIGFLWYAYVTHTSVFQAFIVASAVYIPKDIASLVGAYYFSKLLLRVAE